MIKEPIFTGNSEKDIQLIKESISAITKYINSLDKNYINTGEAVGIDDVFGIYNRVDSLESKSSKVLNTLKNRRDIWNQASKVTTETIWTDFVKLVEAMED